MTTDDTWGSRRADPFHRERFRPLPHNSVGQGSTQKWGVGVKIDIEPFPCVLDGLLNVDFYPSSYLVTLYPSSGGRVALTGYYSRSWVYMRTSLKPETSQTDAKGSMWKSVGIWHPGSWYLAVKPVRIRNSEFDILIKDTFNIRHPYFDQNLSVSFLLFHHCSLLLSFSLGSTFETFCVQTVCSVTFFPTSFLDW